MPPAEHPVMRTTGRAAVEEEEEEGGISSLLLMLRSRVGRKKGKAMLRLLSIEKKNDAFVPLFLSNACLLVSLPIHGSNAKTAASLPWVNLCKRSTGRGWEKQVLLSGIEIEFFFSSLSSVSISSFFLSFRPPLLIFFSPLSVSLSTTYRNSTSSSKSSRSRRFFRDE